MTSIHHLANDELVRHVNSRDDLTDLELHLADRLESAVAEMDRMEREISALYGEIDDYKRRLGLPIT